MEEKKLNDLEMQESVMSEGMQELSLDELDEAAGGAVKVQAGKMYVVKGVSNYLPLRSSAQNSNKNVIGKLRNGDRVIIVADFGGTYKFVRPVRGDMAGYVNGRYLKLVKK